MKWSSPFSFPHLGFTTTNNCSSSGLPPNFKEQLRNMEVEEGKTVTLHCELSKPAASVEWKRGAVLLKNVDKCQIRKKDLMVELKIIDANLEDSGDGICTLVIINMSAIDTGVYTCEVVNKFGVTSYNGNITVGQPQKPPSSTQGPAAPAQPSTPSVHPVLASVGPLQPAQSSTSGKETMGSVESEGISLWQAYNLTEEDPRMTLQERRRASLISASSSKSS
uniref:Ig-like domain-containing protein n=1 Tax=Hucho hucho TaxID=62062 RepID=A0A4W5NS96_9TELE